MDISVMIDWRQWTLIDVVSGGCSAAMIFGGVVPYIPQYRDISRTENTEGFSLYVCLALLIANSLRILFWFGHPYELPLLIQSIIMTAAMMCMIKLCVRIRSRTLIIKGKDKLFTDASRHCDKSDLGMTSSPMHSHSSKSSQHNLVPHTIWDFNLSYFWEWTDFLSYIEFMVTFYAIVGVFMYLFIEWSPFVEIVGFISVLVEAMLGAPQFYRNLINKSTSGMSKQMVFMWTAGDIYKTTYFLVRAAPIQFWICGILQVIIDIAILFQILCYRNPIIPHLKPITHIK